MLSTRDIENIIGQVNARFDELTARLDKVEASIKDKPSPKPAPKAPKASK